MRRGLPETALQRIHHLHDLCTIEIEPHSVPAEASDGAQINLRRVYPRVDGSKHLPREVIIPAGAMVCGSGIQDNSS